MTDSPPKKEAATKGAIVRKAIVVAIFVFLFAIGLFVGFVILAAKLAEKTTGPSGS